MEITLKGTFKKLTGWILHKNECCMWFSSQYNDSFK